MHASQISKPRHPSIHPSIHLASSQSYIKQASHPQQPTLPVHQPSRLPCPAPPQPGNATSSTNTSKPNRAPPVPPQANTTPPTAKAMAILTDDTFPSTTAAPRESSRALALLKASLPVILESECEGALAAALTSLSLTSSASSSASSSPGPSEPSSPRPRYAQPKRVHWDADIMELDEEDDDNESNERKALRAQHHSATTPQRIRRSRRTATTQRGRQQQQTSVPTPPTSRYFQQKKRSSGTAVHLQSPRP